MTKFRRLSFLALILAGVSLPYWHHGGQAYAGESISTLQQLIDIEEIKELRARYANAVDNRRWSELSDYILASDAMLDLPGTLATPQTAERFKVVGREAIINFTRHILGDEPGGSHAVTIPVIELTSKTTAKAIWRLGTASFYDTYESNRGHWQIKSIRFEPNEPGVAKPKPSSDSVPPNAPSDKPK